MHRDYRKDESEMHLSSPFNHKCLHTMVNYFEPYQIALNPILYTIDRFSYKLENNSSSPIPLIFHTINSIIRTDQFIVWPEPNWISYTHA